MPNHSIFVPHAFGQHDDQRWRLAASQHSSSVLPRISAASSLGHGSVDDFRDWWGRILLVM